ncbi:VWA domain-containing protein [Haliangium sp.]|uniref:VWA domain-containing protein n=1 Tax=Haliangium sp. TaxID=2663208 RepID=UPI003D1377EC
MNKLIGFGVLLILLALGACGGQGLQLTLIDASVQKPSNVAVYFTVDTADGEPVAGLEADSFRIYEDERLVSVHESKQTILSPEVAAEHNTLLLVDMSGSVIESGDVPTIIDAASAFGDRVGKYQRVAVYAFDGRPDIIRVSGFSNQASALSRGVRGLERFRSEDSSTNLNGAVIEALRELDQQMSRGRAPLRFGTLVVFTDGTDRAARVTKEELYEVIDQTEYEIFVIGVGAEIDEAELDAIGVSGTVMTKNRDEIASAFEEAAERIEARSQRFYLLGYCSPARAGEHVVRIEAEDGGLSGSLTYDYDAEGFRGNCDPTKKPAFDVRRPRPVTPEE